MVAVRVRAALSSRHIGVRPFARTVNPTPTLSFATPRAPSIGSTTKYFNCLEKISARCCCLSYSTIATMAPTESLDNLPKSRQPIVISGPSGSGKSTMLKRLFEGHPGRFGFSVSHTTRSPRPGESHGEHYNFVTRDDFNALIASNGFIEHAQFGSNLYGTSFGAVEAVERSGKTCILDIEMEGVKQVHKSHLKARFLFLSPPGMEELEKRLRGRGTDKEEDILKRLKQAAVEMEFAMQKGVHDKVVVNDDLDRAYKEVEKFCLGED